jgi:endonuclease/exonuclease/phosphatase family metal-dependent hydrolase
MRRFSFFPASLFAFVEVALMGLFFVQSARLLIGLLYSRTSNIALAAGLPINTPGALDPQVVSNEISFLGVMLALPLLMLLFGRFRFVTFITVLLTAASKILVLYPDSPITSTIATQLSIAGALMFLVALITQRARLFPYFFILGFGLDQVIRAYGNTFDPSMQSTYLNIQLALSLAVIICTIIANFSRASQVNDEGGFDTNKGILTFWSAIGLGALVFIQLALFALPNAITARTDADYTLFVPLVLVATVLPALPFVRQRARAILAPFESNTRGWVWLIFIVLLVIIGMRVPRIVISNSEFMVGGFILTIAQLLISLLWWWFVRPRSDRERNFSGLWISLMVLIIGAFVALDLLTFEYAFIREFAPPFEVLNRFLLPLLRGFRGMGLAVILFAIFLAILPMIQSSRRVPWVGGDWRESLLALLVIIGMAGVASYFSRPIAVLPTLNVPEIRIGTYNLHAGYSEFYEFTLEGMAQAIGESGVQVVLLQDVEAGRLTSFGIDQTLWLARTLGMDRRYFATNEGMQGLAVLSRVPIVFDDGVLIPSLDRQAGLQRVQIQPDQDVIKLYNTSLGLLIAGESITNQEQNQQRQLDSILQVIATHVANDYNGQLGRTILGGTFNNTPNSALMQTLTSTGFIDPFAGAPRERSDTFFRVNTSARIDYIWVWRESLFTTGYGVLTGNDASEHRLAFVGVQP